MTIKLESGKYVVAVSGGVDSVSLLNALTKLNGLTLIVAHFDHGIRQQSAADRTFVDQLAKHYGLDFVTAAGHLGPQASEATARHARYDFLNKVRQQHQARAIITAHHQDDVLETAIINLHRGTGRKGLTALDTSAELIRPWLGLSKTDILGYANQQALVWREDSTNHDSKYLRNYIRLNILPRLGPEGRTNLLKLIAKQRLVNAKLDSLLIKQLSDPTDRLERDWFSGLPHTVAREVMATWLRRQGLVNFDKSTIERAVVAAKTSRPGKKTALKSGILLELKGASLALTTIER